MISYGWLYLTRGIKNNIVIGICVFCLLLLINNYLRITVPVIRIASQEFASAILFLSGYLFSKNRVPLFSPVICLSSFCLLCLDYFCWSTHMAQPFFDNSKIFLYLVIAIMVIWSLYSMTFNLLNNYHLFSFIELVGNNTLTILTWHFLSFKVVSCVIIVYYELPVQKLSDFPIINDYISQWWNILYFISAIILTSGLACFNRYIKYSWLKL